MKINPQDNISLHPRYHLWTVLSLLFFLSIPLGTYSQEKDLSSLTKKKNELENRPGFKETDTNYIKVIYKLARGLRYRNPDSTKILSEKAIALSEPQNYTKGIAGGKLGLGIFHVLRGNFEEGFHNADQAIELAKSIHADTIHLRGINTNAVGHFLNGDYPQTYILCKEGESLSENTGNNEMLITFVTNLATCFSLLEEYEQALIYYKKASALLKDSNNQAELSRIQCNIAYTHLQIGQYDEGKKYCDLAIKGFQNDGFVAFEAFARRVLGEILMKEDRYDESLAQLKKAEELLLPIKAWQRKAETNQAFAELYLKRNELEKSREYALKAEGISKKIKYSVGIASASEVLFKIANNQRRTEEALEYLLITKHLKDSILESRNKNRFLLLEAKSKFEEEQKSIQFENEKKLAERNLFLIVFVSLILLLSIMIFFATRNVTLQKATNKKLKKINDDKDRIFSIIGHDLKSPINTLMELLELYAHKAITEKEIIKTAPKFKESVEHSSFTLNNLLLWAQTQMNGIVANPKEISIKTLTEQICGLFALKIEKKKANVQCHIPPNASVLVDRDHLGVILRNLISNSIKFIPENGTITFNTSIEKKMVAIEISDSGIGMKKEKIKAILEGKRIAPSQGTSKEKGTGIGLQITTELVHLNRGSLEIFSTVGKGTTIKIKLPKA